MLNVLFVKISRVPSSVLQVCFSQYPNVNCSVCVYRWSLKSNEGVLFSSFFAPRRRNNFAATRPGAHVTISSDFVSHSVEKGWLGF